MAVTLEFERAQGDPVMGIDEAGRGPLVGGVYAAAVSVPLALAEELLAGPWSAINDSKKLTEKKRFALAEVIKTTPGCVWAIASASPAEIDRLNILKATHLAMRRAAGRIGSFSVDLESDRVNVGSDRVGVGSDGVSVGSDRVGVGSDRVNVGSDRVGVGSDRVGVGSDRVDRGSDGVGSGSAKVDSNGRKETLSDPRILVDGLPVPTLPNSTNVIKGDAKSLFIAAASILAKTARDEDCFRLEREYPGYGFAKHKGYPTPAHLKALAKLGPCPEHRRSFGPVAQMELALVANVM